MELDLLVPTHCTGDRRVPGETVRDWARGAERDGFGGLWALSHPVRPPTYATAFLDPLATLSHVAAVTDEIPLGTSVLLLSMRRTANVASTALSIAHLANRQLTLGVGAGNNPKEFEVAGVPMDERGPRLTESIEVLQALFDGEASYEGRFHAFEDVRVEPTLDEPPRIVAGGTSRIEDDKRRMPEPVLDRIVDAGGWIAPPSTPGQVAAEWELIESHAKERGDEPAAYPRIVLQYVHLVDDEDPATVERGQREAFERLYSDQRGFEYAQKNCLVGTIDEIGEILADYAANGVDRVILGPARSEPEALDEQRRLASERLMPRFS